MWTTISIIFVIVWSLLLWEAWNSPIMPDDFDTKKYKKKESRASKKSEKSEGSILDLKRKAMAKANEIQLGRDLGYQVKRSEIVGKRKLVENRIKQLIRLGATQEEAEKIAKEEETDRKERANLEKELLILSAEYPRQYFSKRILSFLITMKATVSKLSFTGLMKSGNSAVL